MIEKSAMNLRFILIWSVFLIVFLSIPSFSLDVADDGQEATLDGATKTDVAESISKLLVDKYIFLETAEKMQALVETKLKEGKYDSVKSVDEFARVLTEDLRSVSKDKHIRVIHNPDLIRRIRIREGKSEEERKKEREKTIEGERQRNFGFQKMELLEGNIGYLDLRYFSGVKPSGETAVAAMNFLSNANAIIIDLRKNGGGNPSMIQLLSSYFLDDYTHLNSFENRGEDTLQQFWTLPYVPGRKMYETDLYVLTSRRTFSGAEEFTYNMKNLERATIIGETTGGGAHPGGFEIATRDFLVWIPTGRAVNPITKTNWEGTGIEPHISVPQEDALDKAHGMALEKLIEKTDDARRKTALSWALDGLKAKTDPIKIDLLVLKKYTGKYTRGEIKLEDGQLYFDTGSTKMTLIPLTETYFILEGQSDVRVEFVQDHSTEGY
ncbi:MAG: S41 family peptidase, partial [Candidatus Aminicenantes bacterium]